MKRASWQFFLLQFWRSCASWESFWYRNATSWTERTFGSWEINMPQKGHWVRVEPKWPQKEHLGRAHPNCGHLDRGKTIFEAGSFWDRGSPTEQLVHCLRALKLRIFGSREPKLQTLGSQEPKSLWCTLLLSSARVTEYK